MACKLWMWEMMLDSVPEGTVTVSREAITLGEVEDHLKDTLDLLMGQVVDLIIAYPILGHPLMHPDMGFIELVNRVTLPFPTDSTLNLIQVVHSPIFMSKSQSIATRGRWKESETMPQVR
jgi:hypothetical protein